MSKFFLDSKKVTPDNFIIVAGLNDVLSDKRDYGHVDCRDIAQRVVNIGKTAKESGVARICISELIKPRYEDCHQFITEVNDLIKLECQTEGFIFITQSNIGLRDLGDNLHVSRGPSNDKLKHNIFSHCYTYNDKY